MVCFDIRWHKYILTQDEIASNASCLPYELLTQIIRLIVLTRERPCSQADVMTLCLVSKHWCTAATDTLYRYVAPRSLRSAELLLRTLQEDAEGLIRGRIKILHLPMINHPVLQRLGYDESGIPILGTSSSPLFLNFDDIRYLSQTFNTLISLCMHLEELHAPAVDVHTRLDLGLPYRVSTLRQLLISGRGTLSLLVQELLLKIDSSTLGHLESLAMYKFEQTTGWGGELGSKVIKLEGNSPLPNLRGVYLQDGDINITTVEHLLSIFGTTLKILTLLNLRFVAISDTVVASLIKPSFPNLETLIVDTNTLRCLCHKPSVTTKIIDTSLLRNASMLHTFEIRLLNTKADYWFNSTSPEWFPTRLVKVFPIEWQWMQNLPSSLQALKVVAYLDYQTYNVEFRNIQRMAADELKHIICRGSRDLTNLQLKVLCRTTIYVGTIR
jgi:hypothetical protein